MTRPYAGIGLFIVLLGTAPGAAPRAQAPAGQGYSSGTTAILVDVVVRDRAGRPVVDLNAADFEVLEDGVAQKVDSFTRITQGGGIGVDVRWRSASPTVAVTPTARAPETPTDPAIEPATTALVFDHLGSETLRLAQRATLSYIPMNGESDVRVGVFATEAGLHLLQPYTTDRTRVRQAITRVVPSSSGADEQKASRADELVSRRRELQGQTQSAAAGVVAGSGAAVARNASELGERENELKLIQTELNMMRSFDNLDRDHQGYDTSLALLGVVRTLASYPGRKTIVFFSEGLPVSPALSSRLDTIIEAANRANVTTYAVDAHGLRARSTQETLRKEMDAFAEERMTQNALGNVRTEQPLTMAFERVEDTLRLDSRTGLARLSQDTGGFLIEGSNDLTAAFRRIDEDNRFHYLLTYSPKKSELDGKFRAIDVRVRRAGTQVFARKGYRAIAKPSGIDASGYETPALALLTRRPFPNAFPMHAAAFTFPEPARPGLTPILVNVATDVLHYTVDPKQETYSAAAAIVVRLRDGAGREVQKLSQQYVITGEARDVEAARKGTILFYREADLDPGVYTMESVVYDPGALIGSARVSTLTVAGAEKLAMSSLVLVNRIEEVSAPPAADSAAPLYVGSSLLYPNLGEPYSKASTRELPFYFALYGSRTGLDCAAQLLRNGAVVAEAPVTLAAPTGPRLQQVGRLPIDTLAPGTYELRIRVRAGADEAARTAYFTVVE